MSLQTGPNRWTRLHSQSGVVVEQHRVEVCWSVPLNANRKVMAMAHLSPGGGCDSLTPTRHGFESPFPQPKRQTPTTDNFGRDALSSGAFLSMCLLI